MLIVLAESYLHRLDPFAIQFTHTFGLRWYGLAYVAGFLIAWWMIRWMARTGRSPIPAHAVADMMFYAIVGVLVGGRLGFAVFYDPHLFIGFSSSPPWWDLFAINKGGMASHGGMIGVILVCWIFAHKHKVSPLHIFDMGALACTPGFFLGRLANFINAELWGRPLPASMQQNPPFWSIKYPEEILQWDPRIPADAARIEALQPLRSLLGGDATVYQAIVEATRAGNEQVIEVLRPLLTAYYPSQIFQALTDGLLVAVVLALIWLKPRKAGVVGSWYLIVYGVMRIATEVFRQPDEGVVLLLGLSRGQVLSVVMILAGVVCLIITTRRSVEPIGGLLRPKTG